VNKRCKIGTVTTLSLVQESLEGIILGKRPVIGGERQLSLEEQGSGSKFLD
jgi:hypothetical protein